MLTVDMMKVEFSSLSNLGTALPQALNSALNLGSDGRLGLSSDVRKMAIALFSHLKGVKCSVRCKWGGATPQGSLTQGSKCIG